MNPYEKWTSRDVAEHNLKVRNGGRTNKVIEPNDLKDPAPKNPALHSKYNPTIVMAFFLQAGLPHFLTEHQFHPSRKWRFDFAWPDQKLALEVQGGLFINGGHNRGAALRKEHEKRNEAARLGWRMLYVEPDDLLTSATADLIRGCL